jgi:uncharacterized protein DUF2867
MKASPAVHLDHPWLVHTLAPDFELLDVWRFDAGGRSVALDELVASFWEAAGGIGGSLLGRARLVLGRVFGWDDHDFSRAIPGCRERSLAERLTPAERAVSRAPADVPSPLAAVKVRTVYVLRDEALYEVSNDTIHALIHCAVADGEPTLAVYIKSRGVLSRLYMAAIGPLRHAVVYPALVRRVEASLSGATAVAAVERS